MPDLKKVQLITIKLEGRAWHGTMKSKVDRQNRAKEEFSLGIARVETRGENDGFHLSLSCNNLSETEFQTCQRFIHRLGHSISDAMAPFGFLDLVDAYPKRIQFERIQKWVTRPQLVLKSSLP